MEYLYTVDIKPRSAIITVVSVKKSPEFRDSVTFVIESLDYFTRQIIPQLQHFFWNRATNIIKTGS